MAREPRLNASEPTFEDAEDALISGDRTLAPGTARAALSHTRFRRVYFSYFASNIGTWMQNIVLAVLAHELTGEAWFIGVVVFAQLGPFFLVGPIGGAVADRFDRRRLMIILALVQLVFSLLLAWIVSFDNPSKLAIVGVVFAIGSAAAINAPTFSALLPQLVGLRDLPGAISLNSFQMNASRVIGPVIATPLSAVIGPSWVFVINAATYLFAVGGLLSVRSLPRTPPEHHASGLRQILEGIRVARRDHVIRRVLLTVSIYSFFSLVFIYQMPTLVAENLGKGESAVGPLFACFGLGAALGALSLGTVLNGRSLERLARASLAGFAVVLALFALNRAASLAYPLAFAVGFCYFMLITSLMTILQQRVDDQYRGRVMALWMMGWAGLVPVGGLVAAPLIDLTSITVVLLVGAAVAATLVPYADFTEHEIELVAPESPNETPSPRPA